MPHANTHILDRVHVATAPTLWTFQDTMDRMIDRFGETQRDGRNERLMREATLQAYRDFPSYHDWSYYRREHQFTSEPNYGEGTVSYSAATNQFTLTGGIWPQNARYGALQIGRNHWPLYERVSDTTATADTEIHPASDIADATYRWFRESYAFPARTRKIGTLYGADNYQELQYVDTQTMVTYDQHRLHGTASWPYYYTIRNDDRYLNSLSIILLPAPTSEIQYTFREHPGGQELTTEKLSAGTATVDTATSATTVTFSDPILDSAIHVGCVLRMGDGNNEPTTILGAVGGIHPFKAQRIIRSVTSANACEVSEPFDGDFTDVKFTVSSPLDIRYDTMLTAFWDLVQWEYSKVGLLDGKRIGQARNQFHSSLAIAQAADNVSTSPSTGKQTRPTYSNQFMGAW